MFHGSSWDSTITPCRRTQRGHYCWATIAIPELIFRLEQRKQQEMPWHKGDGFTLLHRSFKLEYVNTPIPLYATFIEKPL